MSYIHKREPIAENIRVRDGLFKRRCAPKVLALILPPFRNLSCDVDFSAPCGFDPQKWMDGQLSRSPEFALKISGIGGFYVYGYCEGGGGGGARWSGKGINQTIWRSYRKTL